MQNKTIASVIHVIVAILMKNPNFPSENVEWRTARRPRRTETNIGIPYETERQIVAHPVNALKAAVDPKY
jgi:hypothetical protein